MSTKRVVIVKKSASKKPVRKPRFKFATNTPVNVKVAGERRMMKSVVLVPFEDGSKDRVKVLTGRVGRPMHLPVESIERVRVL